MKYGKCSLKYEITFMLKSSLNLVIRRKICTFAVIKVIIIMTIRKLKSSDREAFFKLTKAIVEALENRCFLIPMSEEEADATFRDDS